MDLEIIHGNKRSLVCFFSTRELNIQQILSYLLQESKGNSLIIDTNHRWNSKLVPYNSHIFQPKTRKELLDLIQYLPELINPRLKYIIIDNLPLYFRDYYQGSKFQNQNMRAYGASLALLKRLSKSVFILFTSYPSGINLEEPIMLSHTQYYTDAIFKLIVERYGIIKFIDQNRKLSFELNLESVH